MLFVVFMNVCVTVDRRLLQVQSLTADTCGQLYEMQRTIPISDGMENLEQSITNLIVPSSAIIDTV
jgi:hypothetical protein